MINDIQDHAKREYPNECCGLVVKVDGIERYWPCNNVSDKPTSSFLIAKHDWCAAEDAGDIVAIVHSHPDDSGQPSDSDRVMCEAWAEVGVDVPWHILSIGKLGDDQFDFAELVTFKACGWKAPLVGRKFAHGILDCYTLVRDFYSRELNIDLPNFEREDDWWHKGGQLYSLEHFEQTGFREVPRDSMQRGDVIVMQIRSPVPNHAGVYLGDGRMLHHMYDRLSTDVPYGGMWAESTNYVMRYEKV